jgi:radical SAM protein with 4Fe4S-binding SPASM domain
MTDKSRRPHFAGDGVHHATINGQRFHLRPNKHGGLLWLNGQQPPYQLDHTAADFVKLIIAAMWQFQQGEGDASDQVSEYVVREMLKLYRPPLGIGKKLDPELVKADLDRIYGTLMGLAQGNCPAEIDIPQRNIKPQEWQAPARMDLALTYRCNLACAKCYNDEERALPELSKEKWLEVYQRLWKIGIPQVVFTGGEPTLRNDLVDLISEADEFVTGLVTNGTRLAELAPALRDASLDYAQVTIESLHPQVHDEMTGTAGSHALTVAGLTRAREVGLQLVTNTTLTRMNAPHFVETVTWLHDTLGIENIACNTLICSGKGTAYKKMYGLPEAEIVPILQAACWQAEKLGVSFQWYSPGCYSALNPVKLGLGVKQCSAAAHNMLVQPDGSVLPCQSWPQSVGNILTDPWPRIWNHPTCKKLRDHLLAPIECEKCAQFSLCGGGCPLDKTPRHQPADTGEKPA